MLASLEQGELLLVPAARAARNLRFEFAARQRQEGLQAWKSPRVLSWSEWIAGLWTQLTTAGAESRLLLNSAQEHSLWLEVITEHSAGTLPAHALPAGAFSAETLDSLAGLARSAWQLCGQWEIGRRLGPSAATHDSRTFAGWAEWFAFRCADKGYVTAGHLEPLLAQHLHNRQLELPSELRLLNFGEFTPAQERFLSALRKHLTSLQEVSTEAPRPPRESASSLPLAIAASEREELFLAARWARAQVEAGQQHARLPRVGVLLPDTGIDRAELESVFREVLAPELQPLTADLSSTPWELASGDPLASVALVTTALDLLRWCAGPLPLARASALLLSPYLEAMDRPDATDGPDTKDAADANARFDVRWLRSRNRLRPELTLRAAALLSVAAGRSPEAEAPAPWLTHLDELSPRTDPKLRRSFSEWMEVLRQLLKVAGWPGQRALTAREQAAVRAWEDALDQVATLDFAGNRVPYQAALKAVERQTGAILFQPGTGDAAVTALSPREAAGSSWDALLLLRGSEAHWPPSPRPHPFLGAALQRELRMPGSFPQRELASLQQLLGRTSSAFATCAAENADGALRPAAFLTQLGFVPLPADSVLPPVLRSPETMADVVADPVLLPPLPSPEIQGGARVLQLQAACGFLAFSAMRLNATEVEAREAGLDPRDSGTLLHRSLEQFWNRVRSQEALRAMSPGEQQRVLAECVEEAVSVGPQVENSWDLAYLDLQKQRLRTVLGLWLHRELKRSPFTVAESEHASLLAVGPLTLRVRVDRVDRVENGVVLVDYKSGYTADPKGWLGDRPDQPQLPLYSLLHTPGEVQAVAFAHVRAGKDMRWNGLEAQPGVLPRPSVPQKIELTQQVDAWRSTLTRLATDFSEGKSEVNPKSFTENCKRCAYRLLCRLDPAALHTDQLSEEEQTVEEAYG